MLGGACGDEDGSGCAAHLVDADAHGAGVELRVDDNGPGIEPERRERVFEPYESTRKEGTGLGLAIVKKVVLDHNGEVRVEDSELGGAAVVIRLPLHDPGA